MSANQEELEWLAEEGRRAVDQFISANLRLVDSMASLAAEAGCTPGQLSLAWLLSRGEHVVPIPGTTSIAHLEENLGAASVELTADDLRDIEGAVSKIQVHGARYPEHLQKLVGR